MIDFIKKNIFIATIFLITLLLGFVTFFTFIDKGFIELNDQNLQILLIGNIGLLLLLFFMIFKEVRNSLKIDIDISGAKSNRKLQQLLIILMKLPKVILKKLELKLNQKLF